MRTCVFLIVFSLSYTCIYGKSSDIRRKRDAVGTLDIVTNHAQAIHTDVKSEQGPNTDVPCKTYRPSDIESGVVFRVTPPKSTTYEVKSLRKSLPLTSKLELARSVNRVLTLFVLAVTVSIEFYPFISHLISTIYSFMVE